ncbi:MAG: prepilin peptidase [Trueperaceae bacterium]
MSALVVVFAALLGSVVGSFANVVVYRLPRGESVVHPGSHCPSCNRRLGVLDLVPVLSYLALGGRCRTCKARISPRYPLVEAAMALLFAAIALRWPALDAGAAMVPLMAVTALLLMAAIIDIEHFVLPDALTLPAVAVGVLGAFLTGWAPDLPRPAAALAGALAGAGVLVLINRIGALVLRRFADTKERLWPISLDQVNVAAVAGAFGGVTVGVLVGLASVLVSIVAKRPVRLPEPLAYGLWAVGLVVSTTSLTVPTVTAVAGSVLAAGAWALIGATYWWVADGISGENEADEADEEPVAMGFGDVKLAAAIGAILGWEKLLVAIFFAVTLGAIGGVAARLAGGSRVVPFGPYLVAGGLIALFVGDAVIAWYFGLLGVS